VVISPRNLNLITRRGGGGNTQQEEIPNDNAEKSLMRIKGVSDKPAMWYSCKKPSSPTGEPAEKRAKMNNAKKNNSDRSHKEHSKKQDPKLLQAIRNSRIPNPNSNLKAQTTAIPYELTRAMEGSSSVDSPKVMEELKSSMTSKEYWELKQTIESGKKAQAKLENILDRKPKSTRQSPTIPYESAARGPRTMEGSRKIPYEFKESQQTMEGSSSGTNKDVGRAARLKRMRKK
jgi:hypothetical protein